MADWTDEQDAFVATKYAAGWCDSTIGRVMIPQRTAEAVRFRRRMFLGIVDKTVNNGMNRPTSPPDLTALVPVDADWDTVLDWAHVHARGEDTLERINARRLTWGLSPFHTRETWQAWNARKVSA